MQNITSKIQQVTVFRDRAQINRTAEINLKEGEHTLVFPNLPVGIQENSIRVGIKIGSGQLTLKEVQLKSMFFANQQSEKLKAFEEEIQQLKDNIELANTKKKRLEAQRVFIQNIATKVTAQNGKADAITLNPDTWIKMLSFHQSQLETLDQDLWTLQKETAVHEAALTLLQNQTRNIRINSTKERKAIHVVVDVKDSLVGVLSISYVIHGANWSPLYDIRVDTTTKNVNLNYQALVSQSTGEDWTDVRLALSTATPHISAKMPKLEALYVGLYKEPKREKMTAMPMMINARMEDSFESIEEEETQVEAKGTSYLFHIGGHSTIESNGEKHKVGIALLDMGSELYYATTPSLRERAYLFAKVTNDSNFFLLKGDANVFADNHFISTTSMAFRGHGETFEVAIGVDQSVKVIQEKEITHESDEGIIGMRRTLHRTTTSMTIENNRKNDIKILVRARYPHPFNDKVKVELLQPTYEKDTNTLRRTYDYILVWTLNLKAGEKRDLPLEYVISFSKGETIIYR